MTTRFEDVYRFRPDDLLTDAALNRRFKDIDDRLAKAEIIRLSEDDAFGVVLDRVLGRSEDVIASLRDRLLAITQLQWLTAHSGTARTLAVGEGFPLEVIEEDRALFAPGPFALLSWTGGDPDHYAVVRTLGFDREIGQWDIRVEAFVGDPGPHNDWQISAVAGATLAQLALVSQGQILHAEAVAARNEAVPAAVVAVEARDVAVEAREAAEQARADALEAAEGVAAVNPATLASTGTFSLKSEITPAPLVADAVDYAPVGLETATVLRLAATAPRDLLGMEGGADGRILLLLNVGAFRITVRHDAASAQPANRILVPQGGAYGIEPGATLTLIYDPLASRWRVMGPPDPTPARNFLFAAAMAF